MSGAPRRDIEGEIYSRLYGAPHEASPDSPTLVFGSPDLEPGPAEEPPPVTGPRGGLAAGVIDAVRQRLGGARGPGTRSPSLRRRRTFASRRRHRASLGALGALLVVATLAGALAPDPAVERPSQAAPAPEPRAAAQTPEEKSTSRARDKGRERSGAKRDEGASRSTSSRSKRSSSASSSDGGSQGVTTLPEACAAGGCYVTDGTLAAPRQGTGGGGPGEVVVEVPQQSGDDAPSGHVDGPSVGGSSPGGGDVEVEVEEVDP